MDVADHTTEGSTPGTNTFMLGNPEGPGGAIELEEAPDVNAPAILAGVLEKLRQYAASQGMLGKMDTITHFSSEPVAKAVLIAASGHIAVLEGRLNAYHQVINDQEARIKTLETTVAEGMELLKESLA